LGGRVLKGKILPFFIGLALIFFYSFIRAPASESDLTWIVAILYLGIAIMVFSTISIITWTMRETKGVPAVEYFDSDGEDLSEATPEILYLLEEGWEVKKIVTMVSSNFDLHPKQVYEHVINLISEKEESQEQYDRSIDPLHGKKITGNEATRDVIYYGINEDE